MGSSSRRPSVLICDKIAPIGVEMLSEVAEVDVKTGLTKEELLTVIPNYEAVVVRSATKLRADVLEQATRLEVIGRAGAGLDNIDVDKAKELGITVVNSPDANTIAVAEHTMGLMIALARHLPKADAKLKEGVWAKSKLMGTGLLGKTLGIIGFGRIGREVAVRAKAFGMNVLANQRRPTPEQNFELGAETVDLTELLKQSDFITIHVPNRPETVNMIGADQLAQMKSFAYLINTARGTVIDEDALLAALNEDKIAGAALDVFLEEPATNSDLAKHERVIATPHIAASTSDAQTAAAITTVRQIIHILGGVDMQDDFPLAIVSAEKVVPHEQVDPKRVERLKARLNNETELMNPPVVARLDDHFVVLDGATRTTALKELGYEHLIVQIQHDLDTLELKSWRHVVDGISAADLLETLNQVEGISLVETSRDTVLDEIVQHGSLCYFELSTGKLYRIQADAKVNHLDALNTLSDVYINASHVNRTTEHTLKDLSVDYPDATAVVVYPEYTPQQVLQISQSGHVLPAGITRFIIPGRILQINLALDKLKEDASLSAKNAWLRDWWQELMNEGRIRYFAEPLFMIEN